jgi:hypothetical protein
MRRRRIKTKREIKRGGGGGLRQKTCVERKQTDGASPRAHTHRERDNARMRRRRIEAKDGR